MILEKVLHLILTRTTRLLSNSVGQFTYHILVKKQNGSFRLAVDLRKANLCVAETSFVIPDMDDVTRLLTDRKCKFLSKIDLTSGFHQLVLDEQSKDVTAFVTPR